MKKDELLKIFTDNGIELDEDKQSKVINELQKLSGIDVTNAKKDYDTLNSELNKYKSGEYVSKEEFEKIKTENESNKTNIEELESLRKFKTDTETKELETKRKDSILSMLSDKFDKNASDLLYLAVKDKAEFDKDNKIINSDNLMDDLTNKYKSFLIKESFDGASASNTSNKNVDKQPETLSDALKDYYKIKN